MKLETVFGNQMAYNTCSSLNQVFSIAILIALLVAAGFLGSSSLGLLFIALTSVVLLSSTLLFAYSQQSSSEQTRHREALKTNHESSELQKGGGGGDFSGQLNDSLAIRSPDLFSESECIYPSSTSEDSEVDWPLEQSPDCSDGSISDEESLIEIAIPSGRYIVGHKEGPKHQNGYRKLPNYTLNSFFKGNSLVDLLGEINEMNEEDNLIEIDISEGSIKYSRLRIE